MGTIRKHLVVCAAAALAALAVASSGNRPALAKDLPVEPGTLRIAVTPWLGYAMWYIAQEKGFFKANGLDDVKLINFGDNKDINAALASGRLEADNESIQTLMANVQGGIPIKGILLVDASTKADAILANDTIKSVADLKGKKVAFEEGSASDLLLHYILKKNHMTTADIKVVQMPADSAGAAIISGSVPAAVTYEPYISAALAADKHIKLLAEAGEAPGLISDIFAVREDILKDRPGQVQALLKSWDQAVSYYRDHPAEGRAIISKGVGSDPKDLETAFDGVSYYSVGESESALKGQFKTETYPAIVKAALAIGMIKEPVPFDKVIDPDPVPAQ